jgi:O-antigen/teichoic acid export membrane protein
MTSEGPVTGGAAAATTSASVLRGSAWSIAARGLPQAYVLLISIIAARYLGPQGMGRQSYIAFVSLSTTMLFTGGLSISLMRFIGETLGGGHAAQVRGLMRWAWAVAAGGAVIGGGVLILAGALGADPESAWVLAGVGSSLGILHAIPSALLIGAQRWREASLVGLVTGTVSVPAVLVVLDQGGGITGLFAVETVVAAVNLGWTALLARRVMNELSRRSERAPLLRKRTAIYAAAMSMNVILSVIVFRRSEFFFLERFSSDAEIAIYSIAFAATTAVALLPEALTSTVIPAFATLFGAGEMQRLHLGYARGLRMLALVSLPITAGMLALGPEALRLLYGDDYSGTEPVLRIMLLVFPIIPLLNVSYALLIGLGRIRAILIGNAAGAAVNVLLALILIPAFDARGAAVTNGAAQLMVAVAVLAHTRRVIGPLDPSWRSLAATFFAATAGGLAAYGVVVALDGIPGVVLGLLTGCFAFAALAVVLRILPRNDAEWLAEVAGDRFGGKVARAALLISPAESRP